MQKRIIIACAASLFCSQLTAAEWAWGLGVAASQDVYTDFDSRVVPVPIVAYRGDRLNVYGPYVSYSLFNSEGLSGFVQLAPVFAGYEASDSPVFAGMDDRDFTMAGGAGIQYEVSGVRLLLSAIHDLLGVNEGYQTTAAVSYRWQWHAVTLEPGIAVTYSDDSYVNYYYGVELSETRINRPAYTPGEAVNTQLSLAVSTQQFLGMTTRLQLTQTFYDNVIAESPLTDDDSAFSINLMFSRAF